MNCMGFWTGKAGYQRNRKAVKGAQRIRREAKACTQKIWPWVLSKLRKKTFDMIPHPWILECLGIFGVIDSIETLLANSMKNWQTVLTSSEDKLGGVDIKR